MKLGKREQQVLESINKTSARAIESFLMDANERQAARRLVKKGLLDVGTFIGDNRSTIYMLSSEGQELMGRV